MGTRFAPRPWILSKEETPSSFETWKENLLFNLTVDGSFSEFLQEGYTWSPPSVLHRGLVDDEAATANSRTALQKEAYLNLMLGSIAGFAPVIRRTYFMQEACSLHDIWSRLRTYYRFRKTGALILDLNTIVMEPGESPESLWERISSFIDDNLLSPNDHIQHLGADVLTQEQLTPTLVNLTVVHWLRCIHEGLPALVKQKYATELRNCTLASLRDEISESVDALLAELTGDSANVSRASYQSSLEYHDKQQSSKSSHNNKSCILCQTAKRIADHYLPDCPYVPDADKRFMARARKLCDEDPLSDSHSRAIGVVSDYPSCNSVEVETSPTLSVQYAGAAVDLVIDSGTECNLIEEEYVKSIGATILKASTNAKQADGHSHLEIVGEVHLEFQRYPHSFKFNGLVARKLKDRVIVGMPFLSSNDIYIRPSKKEIHIGDSGVVFYKTQRRYNTEDEGKGSSGDQSTETVVPLQPTKLQPTVTPSVVDQQPTKHQRSEASDYNASLVEFGTSWRTPEKEKLRSQGIQLPLDNFKLHSKCNRVHRICNGVVEEIEAASWITSSFRESGSSIKQGWLHHGKDSWRQQPAHSHELIKTKHRARLKSPTESVKFHTSGKVSPFHTGGLVYLNPEDGAVESLSIRQS